MGTLGAQGQCDGKVGVQLMDGAGCTRLMWEGQGPCIQVAEGPLCLELGWETCEKPQFEGKSYVYGQETHSTPPGFRCIS